MHLDESQRTKKHTEGKISKNLNGYKIRRTRHKKEGGVGPEEADAWRQRLERNFRSIKCPLEYQVELAVHYLSGDAHLWWRAIEGRRTVWTWGELLAEFKAKSLWSMMEHLGREEQGRALQETQLDRAAQDEERSHL
ncbi:unnamed protein product [Microthlaspi erraticum]|uniref:Retrotransposon gag domain-containing protein n=1 Tax=Microthlaspi erraticum TaxID=1685480 RepID=A0A6D2IEV6_9BRAS|nr:unnamed protein product [Microthlaspi erraticum]CAA7044734.1 unnamed protein product [Microthlaspi erraticum]